MMKTTFLQLVFLTLLLASAQRLFAQTDSTSRMTVDSFIRKQKGFIGGLAKNLLKDTLKEEVSPVLQRNDEPFRRYDGLHVRKIIVRTLDFGISIGDTTKALNNKLTRLVNHLHSNTADKSIRKNIFFSKGSKLSALLLGANERHLRDLPFIQDAKISVLPVLGTDSADVLVLTKDVYSLSGGLNIGSINKVEVRVQEDNLFGHGDGLQAQSLYDLERKRTFGYGGEFVKRNIGGSFIDGYVGFKNFARSFTTGAPEEKTTYIRVIKPLVHPYMKWTYALEASQHETENMYSTDSIYFADARYKYQQFDAWAGWNINGDALWEKNDPERLNWLIGLRVVNKHFGYRPENYSGKYFYRYSNMSAVLGALSIFKQNFYKTQYIYGFGRNEDVPVGVDFSLTGGLTENAERRRPYIGLDYQRYFFTQREHYVHFTVRTGTYLYKKKLEDVALLAGMEYFSRLRNLSKRWKQRMFINASIGRQIGYRLNEPLLMESKYGLQGFRNDDVGGNLRATAKAETVFYSPWAPLLFKLAPFVFGSTTVFQVADEGTDKRKLYSAVGGGLRTRNESLIFGTIELRAMYFTQPTFYNERWRIEFNTNIRFAYNKQFIKRPEIVDVN